MSNIGGAEVFVVLLLALLVLGPERLPKAARQVGNFVRQVRAISSGFQNEIRGAMRDEGGPSTPEEARIRPVPAITDRSEADGAPDRTDDDLETDIRARHDASQDARPEPAREPTVDPVFGNGATSDERAAG